MKAKTYITEIRSAVAADHNGIVPKNLDLTIRNYAKALEMRDFYQDTIMEDGAATWQSGSMGQQTYKQHPLCNIYYQQEGICQTYAKMLGLTAAKAAVKTEAPISNDDPMNDYFAQIK